MSEREDVFDGFEPAIRERAEPNPWKTGDDTHPDRYEPDYALLETLIAIPVSEGRGSESGRLAKAIDAWVAYELRRCGFDEDEVWPRLTKPRVLPRDIALLVNQSPEYAREVIQNQVLRNKEVAPSAARVLGRAYVKQVDVLIAHWSRGPELIVSTKSMVSSFRNNLPNRFEESYGDAKNLRGRYPMVSMGFLFVLRSTILDEPGSFDRAVDMLRKLAGETDAYDATCVIVAEWTDDDLSRVRLRRDVVPPDLDAGQFIATLVRRVLDSTPVTMHVEVRQRRSPRPLDLEERD